jgi:TPR repeat protein
MALAVVLTLLLALPATAQDYKSARAAMKRGDYAAALKELQPLAEKGMSMAQHDLGVLYSKGQGVTRNDAVAARWFRKAAEGGHTNAKYLLGTMYYRGRGVPQDLVQAHMWLSLAAERGSKPAVEELKRVARRMNAAQLKEAQTKKVDWQNKHEGGRRR